MGVCRRQKKWRPREIRDAIQLGEHTGCCSSGMPGSCIAAWERERSEMGDPLKTFGHASGEPLAAPDRFIVSIARAIEHHAEHTAIEIAALGEHARDVRPMMLY